MPMFDKERIEKRREILKQWNAAICALEGINPPEKNNELREINAV